MDEAEIRELVNYWFEQTESGDSLARESVELLALDVERKVRHRAEDIVRKAREDIGLLCSPEQ